MVIEKLIKSIALNKIEGYLAQPGQAVDITSSLVPLGDTGLYTTPNTPADPTDCGRYPESPFCGGNPLSIKLIALEPQVILDPCNIGIRLNPVLGFIRLPPLEIVYRYPTCRVNKIQVPPVQNTGQQCIPCSCMGGTLVITFAGTAQAQFGHDAELESAAQNFDGVEHSNLKYITRQATYVNAQTTSGEVCLTKGNAYQLIVAHKLEDIPEVLKLRGEVVYDSYEKYYYLIGYKWYLSLGGTPYAQEINDVYLSDIHIVSVECSLPKVPPPLPSLPDMDCCDDLKAQLAKLKKQLQEIYDVLSPPDFQKSSGPARLIYPGATGDFEIKTYHDLFEFLIRQIDRAVGYLPMKVKIADSNPGVKGGKPVELQINSIADGLKLLIQDMVETEGDADILLNMAIRILYEAGITHQLAAVNNRYLENIEEHLDYKVKHVSADLPMAFTPHAGISGFKPGAQGNIDDLTKKATEEVLPELLKECLVKIKHTEYDDKKTQNERLLEILKHASVAAAALSIPTPGNPFELGDLLNAGVFAQSVRKFLDRENIKKATGVGDLDAFLSEVKSYYAKSAPDATQQDKPYGGDKSELPKINKPGKNKPGKKT